jgi:hypothetical protein
LVGSSIGISPTDVPLSSCKARKLAINCVDVRPVGHEATGVRIFASVEYSQQPELSTTLKNRGICRGTVKAEQFDRSYLRSIFRISYVLFSK